jgi:hypothetical protein
MNRLASLLAVFAFAPACSKKPGDKKHGASPDYGGEFRNFDVAAIAKKFDGKAWQVIGDSGIYIKDTAFAWNGDTLYFQPAKLELEIIGDARVDATLKRKVAELVPSIEAGKAKLASR